MGRFAALVSPLLVVPFAARVLTKDALGTWALIQVVVGFVGIFQDGGLSPYVIRNRDYWKSTIRPMVTTCGALLGFSVGFVLLLISAPVCYLLDISEQWRLFIPLVFVFFFGGLASIWNAELRKGNRFKTLFFATSVPYLLSVPISLLLLKKGMGLWAFPSASLFSAVLQAVMLFFFCRPVSFGWNLPLLSELVRYSRGLVGFNLVNYWARKFDDLLIGRFLGTAALAIYSNAYQLMLLPINQVISIFNPLILPYMTKKQEEPSTCRQELYSFLSVIGIIVFSGMTLLWLEREILINWYLGSGWEEVADLLFWFAPLGMLQSLVNPLGNCYMLSGKNDRFFWMGIANTLVVVIGFVVGLPYGIKGVAIGYVVANTVMIYPNVKMALSTLDGSFSEWLRKTAFLWLIPLIAWIIREAFLLGNPSPILSFVESGLIVAALTCVIGGIVFREPLSHLIKEHGKRSMLKYR